MVDIDYFTVAPKIRKTCVDVITTDGIIKRSQDHLKLSDRDLKVLCTCIECKKVYNKNMMFGKRGTESMCYHCVVDNMGETLDVDSIENYIKMCREDHNNKGCNRSRCMLCLPPPTISLIDRGYLLRIYV